MKVGSKITWTNDDRTTHTATSGTITSSEYGKIFESGFLNKGRSFTFVFDHSGNYEYFCLLHPTMIGKVRMDKSKTIKSNVNVTVHFASISCRCAGVGRWIKGRTKL